MFEGAVKDFFDLEFLSEMMEKVINNIIKRKKLMVQFTLETG